MAKNTVNEKERMVITRIFDAPRALVWEAWTNPKYVMQWWGPNGFTAPVCKIDFRVGGKFLFCMKSPDGQEGWNGGEYHEIVLYEKIVYSMYFADSKGNKIDPAEHGIEHEAIDDARDVVIFEDYGNGQTKLTMIGNETMEDAKNSGQFEGWNETFDKVAAVIAQLAKAK
ncbi:MAG TPA: SRPBCC domain-containing protein [Candidatus Acidoferrum sp.]|nr:SRPBCC domain-containing protein [Candidatus Acidoferrum sp.]